MNPVLRYRYLRPPASLLPDRLLRLLSKRTPWMRDPDDGWDFWIDAGYAQWCRKAKRREGWKS